MTRFARSLKDVPIRPWVGRLARVVPIHALFPPNRPAKPDYLFTSGKENQYNRAGTACLYLSVEEATAEAEFRRQFQGLAAGALQPTCHFFAEVQLKRVLDLREPATLKHLAVSLEELEADWGFGLASSVSQDLGESARSTGIEAILYRSVAAYEAGAVGANLVVFRDAVKVPSQLKILGPSAEPLDRWP